MALHKWNVRRLQCEVLCGRDTCIAWCERNALLPSTRKCTEGHEMLLKPKCPYGVFKCRKNHPSGKVEQVTRRSNTWFARANISPEKVLLITLCFANDFPFSLAVRESSYPECTSSETISDWYQNCREVVGIYLLDKQINDGLIGGIGKVVEIDMCQFGKRKSNIGSVVENMWVVVFIERNTLRYRLEICSRNERDPRTILPLIVKHVAPGSAVITEKDWREFRLLDSSRVYRHGNVNLVMRSEEPVAVNSPTQSETNWGPFKKWLTHHGCKKDNLADRLLEYLFRRKCRHEKLEPFEFVLQAIRHSYPVLN